MKVGIMSMQRVPNLGSFMQAYGLKKTIEELGNEVEFIDFPKGENPGQLEYGSDKKEINFIKEKIIKVRYIKNIKAYKKKHFTYYNHEFQNYLKEYLELTDKENYGECDTLVVGSDEVFNCLNSEYGFTTEPFGDYKNAKKIITYAASCGWTKYEYLNDTQKVRLEKATKKLSAISVRDENTKNFIKKITKKEPVLNLDPVLISDYNDFFEKMESPIISEKYILVYAYYNRISDYKTIKAIKKFAKKEQCKLIAVGSPQFWCDDYVTINPKHILDLFSKANYVITDTFHGTIFSIKSKSQFITLIRKSNNNKLLHLLKKLNLESQIVNECNELEEKLKKIIDYKRVDTKLIEEKKKTIEYLKNSL